MTATVTTESPPRRPAAPRAKRRMSRQTRVGLLFVLPCFLLFLVFRFGPAIAGVVLSLFDYTIDGQLNWKGLDNFVRLFDDPTFWSALRVTAIYTVISVPVTLAVSVGMALLVRRGFRGSKLFRSIFFLPVVTSLVLAAVVFKWVFSADGPWASFVHLLGFPQESWLTNSFLVLPALAIVSVWARFGYDMLIILARLQDLPREQEEAALVDGAGPWKRFRYIILPHLKPALFFVVVIETTASFQVFDLVYVMTGGGPVRSSYTLVYQLYDQGFQYFDRGYASAIGVVLFVLTLVIALVQRWVIGRKG
ncbi:carbohydrate ABC transporter permease [Amycolatopsis samaneae]|uniref:Carbohydrate ABC transporter permease n=1 Tax=Amycolatopsis samaneae TaxID=664691 RepID=A0ABW5GMD7_9PSEU